MAMLRNLLSEKEILVATSYLLSGDVMV